MRLISVSQATGVSAVCSSVYSDKTTKLRIIAHSRWRHGMEMLSVLLVLMCGKSTGHRWIPLTKGQWYVIVTTPSGKIGWPWDWLQYHSCYIFQQWKIDSYRHESCVYTYKMISCSKPLTWWNRYIPSKTSWYKGCWVAMSPWLVAMVLLCRINRALHSTRKGFQVPAPFQYWGQVMITYSAPILLWRHTGRDGVSNCLLNRPFRRRSKKTSKFRVTGLCAGNSPVIGEFPAQMASNAENVSIWWRHH